MRYGFATALNCKGSFDAKSGLTRMAHRAIQQEKRKTVISVLLNKTHNSKMMITC